MIGSVLIANRGEIALRIVRTLRETGIRSVVAYSQADADSLAVRLADSAICIGPADPKLSYLNIPALIAAADTVGVDAIHPGFGFVAESSQLPEICERFGLIFIGPSAKTMRMAGDKLAAKRIADKASVPTIPSFAIDLAEREEIPKKAAKIGFPLILKASGGGGGIGMKVVEDIDALLAMLDRKHGEALGSFGTSAIFAEKYLEGARHIEVQIAADRHGAVLALGDRDCSVQIKHRKVIEEASASIPSALRKKLHGAAIDFARAVGYTGLGTVEFLVDREHNFYFIEINPRIQVEHTVTETVTGLDLVRMPLEIASGNDISKVGVHEHGHAIELRINANDSYTLNPQTGRITAIRFPLGPGVRIDTAVEAGAVITPFYDSMIAKIIVSDGTRAGAIARARRALAEFSVEGIRTNRELLIEVLNDPSFTAGSVDTGYMGRFLKARVTQTRT